jgi:hypothetical protein
MLRFGDHVAKPLNSFGVATMSKSLDSRGQYICIFVMQGEADSDPKFRQHFQPRLQPP